MKTCRRKLPIGVLAAMLFLGVAALSWAAEAPKPDPSGSNTGGIGDIVGASAGAPTAEEIQALEASEPLAAKVADVVGKNRIAINVVWTLVCGFLVMFMQAGFAMAETGFTRAKNAGHTMAMNFMVYVLGMLGYWVCGFALQMGGAGPFASLGRRRGAGRGVRDQPLRQGVRPVRNQRLLSGRRQLRRGRFHDVPFPDGVHGHHGHYSHRGPWPSAGASSPSWSTASSWVRSSIRSTPTGSGAAAGSRSWAATSASATATWISPVRPWCT